MLKNDFKFEHRVIFLSLVFGFLVWIFDAALDYIYFYEGSLWGLLLFEVPIHEFYIRSLILVLFTSFGIIMSQSITNRKQSDLALKKEKEITESLINNMPSVALLTKRGTRQIIASNKYGVEYGAVPGKTCHETWGQQQDPCHWCLAPKAWETGKEQRKVIENRDKVWDAHWIPIKDKLYLFYAFDITEIKQAEEALKKLEEMYHDLYENAPDMYASVDTRTTEIIRCNQTFARNLGYTKEEILGKPVFELYHPDSMEDAKETFQSFLKSGEVYGAEFQVMRKDGSKIEVSLNASAVRDEQGNIILSRSALRDITERKNAEEALRKNEGRLKHAQQVAHLGFWDWDVVTGDMYWSDEAFRMFGLEPQEFKMTFDKVMSLLHPEDIEYVEEQVKAALDNDAEYNIEVRGLLPSGEIRYFQGGGKVTRDANGNAIRFVGTQLDITERKRAEEALQRQRDWLEVTLSSIGDAVIATDPDSKVTFINPVAEKLTGWGAQEALGQQIGKVFQIINEFTRQPAINPVDRVLEEGIVVGLANHTILISRDGHEIPLADSGAPIRGRNSEILGVVLVFRDITESRELEKQLVNITELKKMEQELKVSLKEKELLLQEVHHRVKNNLQVISSLLSLQSEHVEDYLVRQMFRKSQDRVKAIALIHEKLYTESEDFARIDFSNYVRDLTAKLFSTYGIDPESIHVVIRIKDIFLNITSAIPCGLIINELVSNSLKHAFTNAREGEIFIEMRVSKTNDFTLILGDNGIGIPSDIDFQEIETLGLQLVITLVKQLEGTIKLDRRNGTLFEIQFRGAI